MFNKVDAYTYVEKAEDDLTPKTKENITLEELMHTWMAKLNDNCIFISAREKTNIDQFRDLLYKKVKELHVQKYFWQEKRVAKNLPLCSVDLELQLSINSSQTD